MYIIFIIAISNIVLYTVVYFYFFYFVLVIYIVFVMYIVRDHIYIIIYMTLIHGHG